MADPDEVLIPRGVRVTQRPGEIQVQAPPALAPTKTAPQPEELGGVSVSQAEQVAGSYGLTTTTSTDKGSQTSTKTSSAATTSQPPTKHTTQPSKATTAAAKTPTQAELTTKTTTVDPYRPTVFKTSTRAKPNAALIEAAHRQGGTVADPVRVAASTKPATANAKKHQATTATTRPSTSAKKLVQKTSPAPKHPTSTATSATQPMRPERRLASATPRADDLGGPPLPKPKKPGKLEVSHGVSKKIPIRLETPQAELSGHIRAAAQLTWRGGAGATAVSLDPGSHSISIDHGPLSFTDSGRLSHALLQGLRRHPVDAVSGHRTAHPFGVALALGQVDIGGKTKTVKITTHVATQGSKKVVSIDASTEVTKKASGYGQITLKYSLVADVTIDPRKKQKQRSKSPSTQDIPIELIPEVVLVGLLVAILGRRVRTP